MPDPNQPPPVLRPSNPIYAWMIWTLGFFLLVLMMYRFAFPVAGENNPTNNYGTELRRLAVVPPFSLTERNGKTISNRDLAGKVWVADFVYTTCPGPCPEVTKNMASIQAKVADDPHVQLVTFTVDPVVDTPGVLAKYADMYGADKDRWWFLTGGEKQMYDLIQHGFLQSVQDNRGQPAEPGQYTVTHSTYFALVDVDGNLRGIYDGQGKTGIPDLLRDIKVLEKEAGP